jgi:hypothetical protein
MLRKVQLVVEEPHGHITVVHERVNFGPLMKSALKPAVQVCVGSRKEPNNFLLRLTCDPGGVPP